MAYTHSERRRWFRDIVMYEEMLRPSDFADSLRQTVSAAPSVNVTEPIGWFFENAHETDFDPRSLPNVYPWFSTALFFEADVLGTEIPQAFLTAQGNVEWVTDMQLIRVGYVVEPISPRQLPKNTLPDPIESVAACMQIAAFTEPREGPVVAPQAIWTVSVGYDGLIVETEESSGILTVPVAYPGIGVPTEEGMQQFARAGIPLLSACLFSITCGSALGTGHADLQPADRSQEDDSVLYLLECSELLQELEGQMSQSGCGMVEALDRNSDMFPDGIPSRPD